MAARIDELEGAKVATDVQGKAVPCDPALHPHADGADLPVADPAARRTVASFGGHAVGSAPIDERPLERANVRTQRDVRAVQRDDRVHHEVPGPVIGHLATALDTTHGDAAGGVLGFAEMQVLG